MSKATSIVLATVLALAACSDGPTAVRTERLRAVRVSSGIRLENLSDRATGYALMDKNILALIDWSPCPSLGPDCLRLPARGSVVVPFSEIIGYSTDTKEVEIYSWWVLDDGTGTLSYNLDVTITLKL